MRSPSPILVGLLLAATVAVDAVVVLKLLAAGPTSRISFVFEALMTGQLAVVSLWGMFAARQTWTAWVAALAAVGAAGTLMAWVAELPVAEAGGICGSFVALLTVVLWVLKRTPIWRRFVGINEGATWQFSMGHLLLAMTVVAALIAALRGSVLLLGAEDSWKFLVMLTLCDVVLVTATVFVWAWASWLPHWWPRLGAAIAPALVVGAIEAGLSASGLLGEFATGLQNESPFDLIAYTLMVSLVTFLYLELTPMIVRGNSAVTAAADASKT